MEFPLIIQLLEKAWSIKRSCGGLVHVVGQPARGHLCATERTSGDGGRYLSGAGRRRAGLGDLMNETNDAL
jgi:hypothetical protein